MSMDSPQRSEGVFLDVDHHRRTRPFTLSSSWPSFAVHLYWYTTHETATGPFTVHVAYANPRVGESVVPAPIASVPLSVEAPDQHQLRVSLLVDEVPWTGDVGSFSLAVDTPSQGYPDLDDLSFGGLLLTPAG